MKKTIYYLAVSLFALVFFGSFQNPKEAHPAVSFSAGIVSYGPIDSIDTNSPYTTPVYNEGMEEANEQYGQSYYLPEMVRRL